MGDRLERIVRGLIPGQKIAVYPLSTRYCDILTAYGERCEAFDCAPVSLEEPFQDEFLNFDGTTISVRTKKYPCLRINFSDLANIVSLGTGE